MASSANDEAQVLRLVDDNDGIDAVLAKATPDGVVLTYTKIDIELDTEIGVEVATQTRVLHLNLDNEEMDALTIWWRNRRLRELGQGGYAGAP